ncbi:MAG: ribosomal protection-like ABC-F family protein [Candidatus Sumerlaeia bacterium]
MLSVNNLEKFLGGRALLDKVTFQLQPGEPVALVGANGSGKSTLMRVCAGLISSDGGEISMPRDATIGYLPQHADFDSEGSLRDELRAVFREVLSHQAELDELAHRMGEVDPHGEEYGRIADRFGHLQHEIERLGAYDMDAQVGRIAAGLGFSYDDLERPCREFSGGWRMRILLARLLLRNPDVMLLDEPTNHLDLETMIWLEQWIRASDASVLMVSHERAFMDNLSRRIFELHTGMLTVYKGNYTEYLDMRQERWAQWAREYQNQQDEIQKTQKFIDRFRYQATKAQTVQSRIKMLEKIERIPPPPSEPGAIHFTFPECDRGSKEVFIGENVSVGYPGREVLSGIDFAVYRGERVALVGLNGAGKSTLMKLMTGKIGHSAGDFRVGQATSIEYFAQYESEDLHPNNTVWGEVSSVSPIGMDQQVRNILGGFFFVGDDLDKKIEVLSGGERTRVRLARMLFSGANTLLLDEPTNHLDLASRRTLEDAMMRFPGTLVFVSHDRVLLEKVPTRIIEIRDGCLRNFSGNYHDYCRALATLGETSPLVDPSASRGTPVQMQKSSSDGGAASLDREQSKERRRNQRRLEKAAAQIEEKIANMESELRKLDESLMMPAVYSNPGKLAEVGSNRKRLKAEIEDLYAEWEKAGEAIEAEQ